MIFVKSRGEASGILQAPTATPFTTRRAKALVLSYTQGVVYEWDDAKARRNLRRHGVSFEEGVSVFQDALAVTIPDLDHSEAEDREITMGHSYRHRLLFVSHCPRGNRIRIIGVRKAASRERKQYEEEFGASAG